MVHGPWTKQRQGLVRQEGSEALPTPEPLAQHLHPGGVPGRVAEPSGLRSAELQATVLTRPSPAPRLSEAVSGWRTNPSFQAGTCDCLGLSLSTSVPSPLPVAPHPSRAQPSRCPMPAPVPLLTPLWPPFPMKNLKNRLASPACGIDISSIPSCEFPRGSVWPLGNSEPFIWPSSSSNGY